MSSQYKNSPIAKGLTNAKNHTTTKSLCYVPRDMTCNNIKTNQK
jgi:hypothetical protein